MSGGRSRDKTQMRKFQEALIDCDLRDLELYIDKLTYSNRRKGKEETTVRLDRIIVNTEWRRVWHRSRLQCGFVNSSNHKPIILYLEGMSMRGTIKKKRFSL